jgi:hypothetical protein
MDRARRAGALATANGKILESFSRRTVRRMRAVLPLRIALPHIETILALNVDKEVQKDALVIRCSADALAEGSPPGPERLQQLFEETKAIERAFLGRIGSFPVGIVIRYDEVGPVRMRRIAQLSSMAYRILDAWDDASGLRAALRTAYAQPEFERELRDILQLYALETNAVSHAVRLPALLAPLRRRLADGLTDMMNESALGLARDLSGIAYRRAGVAPA